NFQFTQQTTIVNGGPRTVYTFTLSDPANPQNAVSQSFPDTVLRLLPNSTAVNVNGAPAGGTAVLITNDTYVNGNLQETHENISLGTLADAGLGSISKLDANGNSLPFLS